MQDENGNQITFEDWEFANKNIDFTTFKWSQENPIDFVTDSGEKIANYRQEVVEGVPKKGTIFFIHGQDMCFAQSYAYLAQMFASQGFEVCGMD